MHLDFLHPHRRTNRSGWVLLALGLLAVSAVLAWRWLELDPRLQAAQAQLQRAQASLSANEPVLQKLSDEQLNSDWSQAVGIAQQLGTPWEALFAELEAGADHGVALLSLEPDAQRHELLLNGEARDYAALVDYYRYLQSQPMLTSVALQTHQMNRQDRDKPIRFRITAHWEQAS